MSEGTPKLGGANEKCVTCGKTAYPMEKLSAEGKVKICFEFSL